MQQNPGGGWLDRVFTDGGSLDRGMLCQLNAGKKYGGLSTSGVYSGHGVMVT